MVYLSLSLQILFKAQHLSFIVPIGSLKTQWREFFAENGNHNSGINVKRLLHHGSKQELAETFLGGGLA